MTHEEALLKLLAIEPETKDGLIVVTGWPPQETLATLRSLSKQKLIAYGREGRYEGTPRYRLV